MSIVTFVVEAADSALVSISESQFGTILSALGTSLMLAATLALVLLFINMIYQIRPMDGRNLMTFIFKLALVITFALDWTRFNAVSGFVTNGLDNIAGILISSITGETGSGPMFFAARFDDLINDLSEYANAIGANMNWMGGAIMSVTLAGLLALMSAAAALLLVLSKMVVTLLIALAPIMITLTLFRPTTDYFERWLSALISWSMYPVVMAGVFSIQFGLLDLLIARTDEPNTIANIGAALPFLAMVLISLLLLAGIPMIIRTLSGDINSGWASSVAGSVSRKAYAQVRNTTGGQTGSNTQPTVRQPQTAPSIREAAQSSSSQSTGTGQKLQRIQARSQRLQKLER